jgi:hypothetical protein
MRIFVLLHYLFSPYKILMLVFLFPLFAVAQDSIVLPPGYQPYYNWSELPDTLVIELQENYPERWQKDSLYYAQYNKKFADSLLSDSMLKPLLFYVQMQDTTLLQQTLTNNPPAASIPHYKQAPLWVAWAALLVLLGILFLKFSNIRLFNFMFLSFLFPKYCDEALREHDTPVNIYNLMASITCALSYSIFVWLLWVKTGALQIHSSQLVSFLMMC